MSSAFERGEDTYAPEPDVGDPDSHEFMQGREVGTVSPKTGTLTTGALDGPRAGPTPL